MEFTEEQVRAAIESCTDFCCGECPYNIYESKNYPLRCIHKLMKDIHSLLNGGK